RVGVGIRGLNAAVYKDAYPFPQQEDILSNIKGCHWLTTLDLSRAFLQRMIEVSDRWKVTVVS
ncbi:hypothetical protein EDC01DRAFT_600638, partial [Geopyxis carbonaria]